MACPPAGISIPFFAYRSCPAAFTDPLVGTLADNLLTLTLWSFFAWTLEGLVVRLSSSALASGTVYATGKLLRHDVVHGFQLNVIFSSFQSIVGLCSHNYGILRMTSWY